MEWQDQGVITAVRKHGETSVILEVLTENHGRHAGVVRGGVSRKMTPVLQPGNQVELEWRARLEEHLGAYRVELLKSRSGILADRGALAALGSVTALIGFAFPERMQLPQLYYGTLEVIEELASGRDWTVSYGLWELMVLEELGYGLDLSSCAVTGVTQELVFVSPKSGRSVSRNGAGEWADRLLPLPEHLRMSVDTVGLQEVLAGLKTTGYFLEHWLAPALGNKPVPDARARLLSHLKRVQKGRENAEL